MVISKAQRIVIKIGSSLIVNSENNGLREKWLKSLVDDANSLQKQGKDIIIVSSGAVALGKQYVQCSFPMKLEEKQAAAACGQVELIKYYQKYFSAKGSDTAQILLTMFDSENRRNYLNAKNTLETLIDNHIVPIINENDTVTTDELRFGDNDRMAARVAQMTGSDLLILFSDVDGLYTKNPRIDVDAKHVSEVTEITDQIESMAGGAMVSGVGSGGMITKIAAAKIAMASGCSVILANGIGNNPIKSLESGAKNTLFVSNETPISARKKWIAHSLNVAGEIIIDKGAAEALKKGKSLLPAGVVDVKGIFDRGDTVEIRNCKLERLGLGLVAYSSQDTKLIMGQQSQEIVNIIGFSGRDEIIHRDNLVMDQ